MGSVKLPSYMVSKCVIQTVPYFVLFLPSSRKYVIYEVLCRNWTFLEFLIPMVLAQRQCSFTSLCEISQLWARSLLTFASTCVQNLSPSSSHKELACCDKWWIIHSVKSTHGPLANLNIWAHRYQSNNILNFLCKIAIQWYGMMCITWHLPSVSYNYTGSPSWQMWRLNSGSIGVPTGKQTVAFKSETWKSFGMPN